MWVSHIHTSLVTYKQRRGIEARFLHFHERIYSHIVISLYKLLFKRIHLFTLIDKGEYPLGNFTNRQEYRKELSVLNFSTPDDTLVVRNILSFLYTNSISFCETT
jgi:hypothetical protein